MSKPSSTPTHLAPTVATPGDAELAFAAAQTVVQVHRRLAEWLKVGVTLAQIDHFIGRTLDELGSRSCFLGYKPYRTPAFPSHACLSVNNCVVHGTAGYYLKPMQPGDILKIDIGVSKRGWIGDAAWTYVFKEVAPDVQKLLDCGKESLARGVQTLRAGNLLLAWAQEVQEHVEHRCGFHLVRGLGGHGYGRKLHGPPFVSNVTPAYAGEWPDAMVVCSPGMLLAVEPMIAVGTSEVVQKPREWPVYTKDGSLSVHYEHDVLITEKGPRVLTEGMETLPDVVG
jgi:methionyl aminopeptidase